MKRKLDVHDAPDTVTIHVDGTRRRAFAWETVATAILATGDRTLRRSRTGMARSVFCNMGICFECLVSVDGRPGVRACMTRVEDGMTISTRDDE